ncbi:hypothetical protein CHISP_3377 [Chitinispirillum alkaliphilum]|nr:hypothetical protein CHISP_3377 [Chitinispirillum alkaliphilum]
MCDSASGKLVRFPQGNYLFKQGERTNELYILKSGEVRIFKVEGLSEIELDRVKPGMIIGEMAALDGGARSATGVAIKDVEAYCIDGQAFKKLTSEIPEWLRKISEILVKRLRELDNKIDNAASRDRSDKVAALIDLVASTPNCYPCKEGFAIGLDFLEGEVMDILGLKYSEISGILNRFECENLLKLDGSRIVIKKRDVFRELADSVFGQSPPAPII